MPTVLIATTGRRVCKDSGEMPADIALSLQIAVAERIIDRHGRTRTSTDKHGRTPAGVRGRFADSWSGALIEDVSATKRRGNRLLNQTLAEAGPLIPPHGGFRKLKSFQIARFIYDVTLRFCDRYISRYSRTHDQMVQAARSGVQNIAEGSQASGTSKKTELKLTNVARGSLEELRLDFEDFFRQRNLVPWSPNHPALLRFKGMRCSAMDELVRWVEKERQLSQRAEGRGSAYSSQELVANATLSLLNLCCYLLDRQLKHLSDSFESEGGFTERMYRFRTRGRKQN